MSEARNADRGSLICSYCGGTDRMTRHGLCQVCHAETVAEAVAPERREIERLRKVGRIFVRKASEFDVARVRAERQRDSALAVLREVEWAEDRHGVPRCPACRMSRATGHWRNCCWLADRLAALATSPEPRPATEGETIDLLEAISLEWSAADMRAAEAAEEFARGMSGPIDPPIDPEPPTEAPVDA